MPGVSAEEIYFGGVKRLRRNIYTSFQRKPKSKELSPGPCLDIPEIGLIWKIQWGLACPDHKIGKEAWEEKCRKESIVSDRF